MTIPHTISKNVTEAYSCSPEISLKPGRTIRAEDSSYNEPIPDLKTLALRVIVSNWKDNPILENLTCVDRNALIETLPTDLPFELTITKIEDEFYWKRAAGDRWEYNDPDEHGESWRRLYCERHLAEYLETLEASYFESQREECDKLINLVKNRIYKIKLRSLVATKKPRQIDEEEEEEDDDDDELILKRNNNVHHIPMALVLPQFPNLTEIYLNFGMIYMNDSFEWRDFEFSIEDCMSLGDGIKASPKLRKFSLTRSNLDQPRVAAILQRIASHDNIEELDLSHCKLKDSGALAVSEFLSVNQKLKILNLMNNNIGPIGAAGIVNGILKASSIALKNLDLRLNPLQDEGIAHICALLVTNKTLETLNISGCELSSKAGAALAEVLSSVKIGILILDISNNDFGPSAGESFQAIMDTCPYIVHLDCRMCNFAKDSELSIHRNAHRNKQNVKKEKDKIASRRRSNVYNSLNAEYPQQRPKVGSAFRELKNVVNHSTGKQIDAGQNFRTASSRILS